MTGVQTCALPICRLWHPDDCASTDAAWQAAASQQRPMSLEHRIQLPGGELKWVLLRAAPVRQTPDGLEFAGVMLDVSARRQAEARLTEANQRWKLALESVGDGVWDWDLVGGRELYSDSFLAMYGYRAEDLADDPDILDQLTHPDDVPGMRRDREAHFSGAAPRYLNEHRVRCRDGQWKWVLSRGLVIERDAAGRPLRMIGTHTDITARRQADALRAERDRADAAKQAMGRLLSRVSHELRTPLNAVLGFAQLLEREPGLAATPRAWTRHILLAGQHLLALVDDVLDLGSAQEGQLPLALQPLCARTAFDEAWAMVLAAEGTPQQVTVPVVGEAWVQADPQRLRQILANLLGNAVKFNRPGGQVLRRVRVAGDWVVLEVQDEGAGVAPAALGRLFSPFERLDAARRGIPGTGLGLALSRQLAQAMGGELDVRSPSGEGACFRLHLPAAPAQVATRLRPADLAR